MFLENRFLTRGISRLSLFFMGMLPLLATLPFYPVSIESAVAYLFVCVLWIFLVTRGHYGLIKGYLFLFSCILTWMLILALKEKNFVQMLVGIVGVLVFLSINHWIDRILNVSYNQPDIQWYEGLPSFHPRLKIDLFWNEKWCKGHLRRIDDYGMFVFIESSSQDLAGFRLNREAAMTRVPIRIDYKDQVYEGNGKIRSVFYERWLGIGLQIEPKDLYHYTQYGKIVQILRGEGYAT